MPQVTKRNIFMPQVTLCLELARSLQSHQGPLAPGVIKLADGLFAFGKKNFRRKFVKKRPAPPRLNF
jgi:hypothetical protein